MVGFQGQKLGDFGAEGVRVGLFRALGAPSADGFAQGRSQLGFGVLDGSEGGEVAGLDGLAFGAGFLQPLFENGGDLLAGVHESGGGQGVLGAGGAAFAAVAEHFGPAIAQDAQTHE